MKDSILKKKFFKKIQDIDYPCVMAKSVFLAGNIHIVIADDFLSASEDAEDILLDIYEAMEAIHEKPDFNHSIAVLFRSPLLLSEEEYEEGFWPFLQALHKHDSKYYAWDKRVSSNPTSNQFSFSLKEEAFYIIGMHNKSSRRARMLGFPALIFNLHHQFETLREKGNYKKIRDNIRHRDILYDGSQNPMMENFGKEPEVLQYSGRKIDKEKWVCPFHYQGSKN